MRGGGRGPARRGLLRARPASARSRHHSGGADHGDGAAWAAAVRWGADHVRRQAGAGAAVLLGGYSTGGGLVLNHCLELVKQGDLDALPRKVFLLSPSIGVHPAAMVTNWHKIYSWLPGLRQVQVAVAQPRVRSVQVQLVSQERRRPGLSADQGRQAQHRRSRRPAGQAAAHPDVPVGDRHHRPGQGPDLGSIRQAGRGAQRAGVLRHQPLGEPGGLHPRATSRRSSRSSSSTP